jgi:hypothetical protein
LLAGRHHDHNEKSNDMSPARSISYAPESLRPSSRRAQSSSAPRPEWILCRKLDEFPIPDNSVLQRWTAQGRIRPDDYLVSPRLDVCVQAKDIAELDAVFRKATARLLDKISRGLVLGGLALVWMAPLFGSLMLVSAIAAAILSLRTTCHDQPYRIDNRREQDCQSIQSLIGSKFAI